MVNPPAAERSDEELVERTLDGDLFAFQSLYNRHKQRVYSVAWLVLHSVDDAEEIVQDTLLQAFNLLERFDPEKGRFKTWLCSIARNKARDRRRRRRGEESRPLENLEKIDAPTRLSCDYFGEVVNEHVLTDALRKLPVRERKAIILHATGYKYEEIAELLGIKSENTVASDIRRGRNRLKALLCGEEVPRPPAPQDDHARQVRSHPPPSPPSLPLDG